MDLAQGSGRKRFGVKLAEHVFGVFAQRGLKLSACQAGMHSGRLHLQVCQFQQRFLRQSPVLQA